MGEVKVNGVSKYDLKSGLLNKDSFWWVYERGFSGECDSVGVYYCDPDYLSTFYGSGLKKDFMNRGSLKELLARDEKLLQEKSPGTSRNFGSKKYSDVLFFSFFREDRRVDRYTDSSL